MKIGVRTASMFAALAIAGIAATPASAQRCGTKSECSPVMKQMVGEMCRATGEYWTPKLNDYKVRIDRALSSTDLDALNKLRVRFAMLVDEHLREAGADAKAVDGNKVQLKLKARSGKLNDAMGLIMEAREIASRYRGEVALADNVIEDLSGFVTVVAERAEQFAAANQSSISKDPEASKALSKRADFQTIAADIRSEKTRKDFAMIFDMAIEPILWLYNGGDLMALLSQAAPVPKPIAGIEMPDFSALKQNFPNPATSSTKITYTLGDASSATVVRLFDSRGDLVATYDRGAEGAGEHSLDVDVSGLASGSYLYHLTIQTNNGPRVYSKTMQVVH